MNDYIKILLAFTAGFLLCQYSHEAEAQTYVISTPQGTAGYIQQQGNQATVLTPNGNVVQTYTVYPTQITTPSGSAIGVPSYTVPMTPPSPPSPKVMQ